MAIVTTYVVCCSLCFPRKRSGDNSVCMLQISFARQVWLWLFKIPILHRTDIIFFKIFFLRFTLNLHILVHVGSEEDREGGIRTQGDSVKDGCE